MEMHSERKDFGVLKRTVKSIDMEKDVFKHYNGIKKKGELSKNQKIFINELKETGSLFKALESFTPSQRQSVRKSINNSDSNVYRLIKTFFNKREIIINQ
jgi:cold shock CspA family protein